ncbi:CsbD family protein [Advenella mimigardefordensis]|uniref:Putative stress response protein, CsbD family n=1 Tax=Advenella mimigardefordensis (strain DSM 17166 / LMG 22922 / DPN7) TaxID=1247726 RepID=W0PDF8_ADVMD|nr:CsbD family protein [Advenella mimigardefordensis]AHG63450.1 putative stress response protein, CsbD family [Advenella mimigardefordensis DPN7]
MNKDIAAGKWEQIKGSVKQTWGDLTDDDVAQINGSAQKLAGILQEKYGRTKEEAERQVNDFWSRHNSDL